MYKRQDVYSVYKLNVAPAVATPRVEIWPSGYEAAGTGDVTRRYPSTYIYGSYPRTWCNGGKTQSQTSVLPTGHTVGGQMIFEQHADIVTAGNKALYCCCLLYTSPSPRDRTRSRMPSSA